MSGTRAASAAPRLTGTDYSRPGPLSTETVRHRFARPCETVPDTFFLHPVAADSDRVAVREVVPERLGEVDGDRVLLRGVLAVPLRVVADDQLGDVHHVAQGAERGERVAGDRMAVSGDRPGAGHGPPGRPGSLSLQELLEVELAARLRPDHRLGRRAERSERLRAPDDDLSVVADIEGVRHRVARIRELTERSHALRRRPKPGTALAVPDDRAVSEVELALDRVPLPDDRGA